MASDKKYPIDQLLQDKLKGFEPDYPSTNWAEFDARFQEAIWKNKYQSLLKRHRIIAFSSIVIVASSLLFSYSHFTSRNQDQQVHTEVASPAGSKPNAPASKEKNRPLVRPASYQTSEKTMAETSVKTSVETATATTGNKPYIATQENSANETAPRAETTIANEAVQQSNDAIYYAGKSEEIKADEFVHTNTKKVVQASTESPLAIALIDHTVPLDSINEKVPTSIDAEVVHLAIAPKKSDESNAISLAEFAKIYRQPSRWSFSLNLYPNFSTREIQVDPDQSNKVHRDYKNTMEQSEKGGWAVNFGLDIKYRLYKRLYLGTGLTLIRNKISGSFKYSSLYRPIIDSESGTIRDYYLSQDGALTVTQGISNQYSYLSVPLTLSFRPRATERVTLNIEGGGSMLFFLGAEGTNINYQTLELMNIDELAYSKLMGAALFRVGFNYAVTRRLSMGIEPTFMYYLGNLYKEEVPIQAKPHSMGVNFNMNFKLR